MNDISFLLTNKGHIIIITLLYGGVISEITKGWTDRSRKHLSRLVPNHQGNSSLQVQCLVQTIQRQFHGVPNQSHVRIHSEVPSHSLEILNRTNCWHNQRQHQSDHSKNRWYHNWESAPTRCFWHSWRNKKLDSLIFSRRKDLSNVRNLCQQEIRSLWKA